MKTFVVSLLLITALAFAFLYQRQSRQAAEEQAQLAAARHRLAQSKFTVKTTQAMLGKNMKGTK